MSEWLRLVVDSQNIGFDSRMVLNPAAAPRPFCVALSPSMHRLVRFKIIESCSLYNFFFLGFRQWRSRTDRILTLNMIIRLSLFWSTWSPAWGPGPDSAICAGLLHGRDYSDCRASELKLQKFLTLVFPWIVKNTLNNGLRWGFSNPHPLDC